MEKLLIVLFCTALVGCATTSDADSKTAKNDTGYECEKVKVTGKLVPKTICTTKTQRKDMEEHAKEELKNRRVAVTDVIMNGY